MKKHYDVTLDEEKVNELKVWLAKNGQSLSGYLNTLIDENLQALAQFAPNGDTSKVSFFTLLLMAGKMSKALKKESKK